ncbi:alcohol dehydrogenase catalytic domain-containing protein [Nocardia sp. NPDC059236]|uniref:alcohol dehydrogenase catalytic domain-containing protein n=1 Tax=Nocardia sp. NPDC059236 TaxID=3346783 RepID=UPI0036BDD6E0
MLAGRLHVRAGTFAVEEVPIPIPGRGEVLIRVEAAGVCLSDVHLIDSSLKPFHPVETVTLGHEVAGVIDGLGAGSGIGTSVSSRASVYWAQPPS